MILTSSRLLGLRPRARAVLWGARRGDRQIGSRADVALEAQRKRIAALERAQLEVFRRNVAGLARLGQTSAEALADMGQAVARVGVRMSTILERAAAARELEARAAAARASIRRGFEDERR